ncbi:hypothetical protein ACH5RR_025486 [Cinchona calisaya]|uniref:Poor homologous synapsis 1 PH domain-containing protein n=1 Tax=Cinchona calisaya TaxID=153742 RepID=A0ABD2Z267_9GENT
MNPSSSLVIINLEETQQQNQERGEEEQMAVMKEHFEIEYAVFFNYRTTFSKQKHNFQSLQQKGIPISKRQRRSVNVRRGGTWLSSSAAATLFLFRYSSNTSHQSPLVLLIALAGRIHEEHFISKLHFSWPQMSCVSQSPPRGSRVVIASYKDSVGQTQKFAMRFLNSSHSQSFIDILKENLKDAETIGEPSCNVLSGIQPENELIHSDEMLHGAVVEFNPICPAGNCNPLVQPSLSHVVEDAVFGGTSSSANNRNTDGNLPSSFTAFLKDSSNDAPEESLKVPREVDLFSQLAKNLAESTFHVMLGKIEKFIKDREGGLALEWS